MLKTIEELLVYDENDFESYVRAFETANLGEQSAELDSFLPDEAHPEYSSILSELIRLDMEFSWARDTPHRLAHFQSRYPSLLNDPIVLQEIAFEEYRLRLSSGERPSIDEYSERLGIDCADWPRLDEGAASNSTDSYHEQGVEERTDATRVMAAASPEQEMRNAAMAYTVFRLSTGWSGDEDSAVDWSQSIHADTDASDFFRDLHQADPEAACRMAQATAVMPQLGTRFLDFELVAELGRGTFGRVFLAKQANLAGRPVAIKITAEQSGESRALAQLQHTHIVPIYSVHRSGPFHAVVMPYFGSATLVDLLRDLKGQETQPQSGTALVSTLHAKIQGGKARSQQSAHAVATLRPSGTVTEGDQDGFVAPDAPLPIAIPEIAPSEVLQTLGDMSYVQALLWIGARIADALAHAHERGILHRDLKPANILLTDQGPMLLDFNLAADTKANKYATAARLGGTLPYMAPEHLEAFRDETKSVDGRCDIYSLGVILYELLGGRRPFTTPQGPVKEVLQEMIEERRSAPRSLLSLNRAVTPAIEAIVSRCLQADPAMRYQTARQLQEDLHRHLNELPLLHTPEPSLGERTAKWYRRNRKNVFRTGIAAAIAMVFALGGLVVHNERDRVRLAAVYQQQNFNQQIQSTDVFANATRNINAEEMRKAREAAEERIKDYQVLSDPQWKELPGIANLEPEPRAVLLQDMGQLLISLAQNQLTESRATRQDLDKVRLYCDRAEDCYPSGQAPRALWEMRADLASLSGDGAEADRLRKLAAETPVESAADRLLLAMYDFQNGRLNQAIPAFKQLVQEDSKNMLAWGYLGDAYYRVARYADAIPCFTMCIGLAPAVDRFRFDRGQTYYNLGDFPAALLDYDELLKRNPKNVDALMYRALTLKSLLRYPESLADIKAALILENAPRARGHFQASMVFDLMGDEKSADLEYEQGLKAPCMTELDWVARGSAAIKKHPNEAIEAFDQVLQRDPGMLTALRNKVVVLSNQGLYQEAIAVLDEMVKRYPSSVWARMSRGTLLARQGKRDLAVKDAEASLKLDPRPTTRYRVAGIYSTTSRQHPEDALLALGNLAAALKAGYGADLVSDDKDLVSIKSLPEFKKLWASAQTLSETAQRAGVH